jgi:hypothetical protein
LERLATVPHLFSKAWPRGNYVGIFAAGTLDSGVSAGNGERLSPAQNREA